METINKGPFLKMKFNFANLSKGDTIKNSKGKTYTVVSVGSDSAFVKDSNGKNEEIKSLKDWSSVKVKALNEAKNRFTIDKEGNPLTRNGKKIPYPTGDSYDKLKFKDWSKEDHTDAHMFHSKKSKAWDSRIYVSGRDTNHNAKTKSWNHELAARKHKTFLTDSNLKESIYSHSDFRSDFSEPVEIKIESQYYTCNIHYQLTEDNNIKWYINVPASVVMPVLQNKGYKGKLPNEITIAYGSSAIKGPAPTNADEAYEYCFDAIDTAAMKTYTYFNILHSVDNLASTVDASDKMLMNQSNGEPGQATSEKKKLITSFKIFEMSSESINNLTIAEDVVKPKAEIESYVKTILKKLKNIKSVTAIKTNDGPYSGDTTSTKITFESASGNTMVTWFVHSGMLVKQKETYDREKGWTKHLNESGESRPLRAYIKDTDNELQRVDCSIDVFNECEKKGIKLPSVTLRDTIIARLKEIMADKKKVGNISHGEDYRFESRFESKFGSKELSILFRGNDNQRNGVHVSVNYELLTKKLKVTYDKQTGGTTSDRSSNSSIGNLQSLENVDLFEKVFVKNFLIARTPVDTKFGNYARSFADFYRNRQPD